MRLLLTFIIFILGVFYTFGDNNCCEQCCEQCCECLGNCCNKEEFYLGKSKVVNSEEIEKLVNTDWYKAKKETASFIFYEKIDNIEDGGLNNNDEIKVTKDKNGFSIDEKFIQEKNNNEQKWALFEIIYKEKKVEEEEGKTVYLYCSDIESTIANDIGYGIFESCKQHISISVIACDTSGVTNMSAMFYNCSSLTGLDLSKFDTKNVIDMYSMFFSCKSLTKLDLSNFNTEKVTNMSVMFYNCSSLTELDLSNFNTKKVTKMSFMFFECNSLMKLDLSNFNTDNVTYMFCMFDKCVSLHTVTFNNNLNEDIKQQLRNLGLKEEVKEEGNKITLGKKNN